ncbi:MAG: type IV toxin-antitoxin system AbiEi family antitoxin domain-containing protein [Solirubrobacterales bacterium]
MDPGMLHSMRGVGIWALAKRQHGVVARAQLLDLGLRPDAIKHRISTGRLHSVWRGVCAVGRPQITANGRRLAAVLCCRPGAALSPGSAAALWEIGSERPGSIAVSVPGGAFRRRPGIVAHRRVLTPNEISERDGIPLTAPVRTLVDIACRLRRRQLEKAIKEADTRGLCDPETLRAALGHMRGQRGVGVLRRALDRHTFILTDSELERAAHRGGLIAVD